MINPEIEKDYIMEKLAGNLNRIKLDNELIDIPKYLLDDVAEKLSGERVGASITAHFQNPGPGNQEHKVVFTVVEESLAEYALRKGEAE